MKKFLLLLIIPLFIFSQNKNDSIREFFSINVSSIDNTFGATSSTFYSNSNEHKLDFSLSLLKPLYLYN